MNGGGVQPCLLVDFHEWLYDSSLFKSESLSYSWFRWWIDHLYLAIGSSCLEIWTVGHMEISSNFYAELCVSNAGYVLLHSGWGCHWFGLCWQGEDSVQALRNSLLLCYLRGCQWSFLKLTLWFMHFRNSRQSLLSLSSIICAAWA